ncbi:uncharacterized protein LOC135393196 [Ornithodoros turicata]
MEVKMRQAVKHKSTQKVVATSTLGTQTRFSVLSRSTQTEQHLPLDTLRHLRPSQSATEGASDDMVLEGPLDICTPRASTPVQETEAAAAEDPGESPLLISANPREDEEGWDTTIESLCMPDPKDTTVHLSELTETSGNEDDEPASSSRPQHSKSHIVHLAPSDDERLFLVAESSLRELLSSFSCCDDKDLSTEITLIGTWIKATTDCSRCCQRRTWSSQPWIGSRPLGNILFCSSILFSGVNIAKTFRMFEALKVATLSKSQYYRTQREVLLPAVNHVYQAKQKEILDELQQKPLIVAGDGRCDSPGHTALYGTYTLLETSINRIIHFELVKATEVSSSNAMEKNGLQRCLAFLEWNDMVVDTLITDRHTGIKAMMRDSCPHVKHRFDVWHVVKGIKKKLIALSRSAKHQVVRLWIDSLVRHAYWCPKTSGEDGNLCLAKWMSALNHIVDIHEHDDPAYPVCYHGATSEPREWLREDSETYRKVVDILKAPALLKDVPLLSSQHQTYGLEAFHSVLIHFVPKSHSFSDEAMLARTQLAVMHYNENADRDQIEKEGSKQYRLKPSKVKKAWVAVPLKEDATYDYVSRLTTEVLSRVERHQTEPPVVEAQPPWSASYGEKPSLVEAVKRHQTRFKK